MGGGGLNLVGMFQSMGPAAIAVAVILFIMSFWSIGVLLSLRAHPFWRRRCGSGLS